LTEIPSVLERILELSRVDACVAIGNDSSSANVRWANNTSTTNGYSEGIGLTVVSIKNGAPGVVSRNHFSEDELEEIVRASEAACEGKPPAQDHAELPGGDGEPGGWQDPYEPTSPSVLAGFAADLAEAFEKAAASGIGLFGYADHNAPTIYLATSSGIRQRHRRAYGTAQFTARNAEGDRSVWTQRPTPDFIDLDVDGSLTHLTRRLEWSKEQISLPAGRYQVILEPQAVSDMLFYAYIFATAREAEEGRSVFSKAGGGTRIGEEMFPVIVNLYSDPNEPQVETAPFVAAGASSSYSSLFDNGMEVGRTDWVSDGVLRNLITPRYWADKSQRAPTPYVPNLIFPSEGSDLDQMIAATDGRALLITRFWYIRTVDPKTLLLTGLTRDGVFLVEDGEVKGAVNNFRFNMSPVKMLANATEVGKATLASNSVKVPPIRVEDFHMSSVSEAT
jgi:predicted Zn-dependent protease